VGFFQEILMILHKCGPEKLKVKVFERVINKLSYYLLNLHMQKIEATLNFEGVIFLKLQEK
jgi:hypothetical protein